MPDAILDQKPKSKPKPKQKRSKYQVPFTTLVDADWINIPPLYVETSNSPKRAIFLNGEKIIGHICTMKTPFTAKSVDESITIQGYRIPQTAETLWIALEYRKIQLSVYYALRILTNLRPENESHKKAINKAISSLKHAINFSEENPYE